MPSELENQLLNQIRMVGLPEPERNYQFAKPRRFAWDGCWPNLLLAYEVQGGLYVNGAHVRPAGYERDAQKHNLGVLNGWSIFIFTGHMIESGTAIRTLEQALGRGVTLPTPDDILGIMPNLTGGEPSERYVKERWRG